MLKSKKGVFDRLSSLSLRARKHESRKVLSHDDLSGSYPIIDADFVEVDENLYPNPESPSRPKYESIDPEMLEKLKEYLKTRSQEEISEIFEEAHRILENRASKGEFYNNRINEAPYDEKEKIAETLKSAFRLFSETASFGKKRIISASKIASSKASSIASDGKESIKISSKMLNEKWNNLSPRDRKIISEVLITAIEIALLRNSSRGKQAAFAILSSVSRHQTPGKKDLEDIIEGFQRLLMHRR